MIQPIRGIGSVYSAETSAAARFTVAGMRWVSVAAAYRQGSWPTDLVLTIEGTLNGADWDQLAYFNQDTGATTAVATITANARRRRIPVEELNEIRVRVSTISSAAHQNVSIEFYGEAEDAILPLVEIVASQGPSASAAAAGGPGGDGGFVGFNSAPIGSSSS